MDRCGDIHVAQHSDFLCVLPREHWVLQCIVPDAVFLRNCIYLRNPQQFCHQSVLSCGDDFVLPVRPECFRGRYLRENVALRFPYLYVCFVFMAYLLMYSIQHYWVEKQRRQERLERRVREEKEKLWGMSMRVMNAMCRALGAKIPGEEEHCRQVAEYAKEIAKDWIFRRIWCPGLIRQVFCTRLE